MTTVFTDRLSQSIKIYTSVLLSWRSIITFGLCVIGILLFHHFSWMPMQLLLTKVIGRLLELGGHSVIDVNNCLIVDGFTIRFNNLCTYANRILAGLPFIWRGDGFMRDASRIIVFAAIVSVVNIIRIYFAIVWHLHGIPWKYSHTLFTHLISWSILILIFLLWLRWMKMRSLNTDC